MGDQRWYETTKHVGVIFGDHENLPDATTAIVSVQAYLVVNEAEITYSTDALTYKQNLIDDAIIIPKLEKIAVGNIGNETKEENIGIYDLLGFDVTYGLNSIPTASVSLPLGFDPTFYTQTSTADDSTLALNNVLTSKLFDLLVTQPNAKIYVRMRAHTISEKQETQNKNDNSISVSYNSSTDWTPFKCLFDGYITQSSIQKNAVSDYSLSLGLTHWLIDLNLSPAINSLIHPNGSQDYGAKMFTHWSGCDSVVVNQDANSLISLNAFLVPAGGAEAIFNQTGTDTWRCLFHPVLTIYAKNAELNTTTKIDYTLFDQGNMVKDKSDPLAGFRTANFVKEALARFVFAPCVGGDGPEYNWWIKPLRMSSIIEENNIGLWQSLGNISVQTIAESTLWGTLLNWGREYDFAVIPGVSEAYVQPLEICCRDIYATIYNSEIINLNTIATRPIAVSAVIIPPADGAADRQQMLPPEQAINTGPIAADTGGYYFPYRVTTTDADGNVSKLNKFVKGLVLFNRAPSWTVLGAGVVVPPLAHIIASDPNGIVEDMMGTRTGVKNETTFNKEKTYVVTKTTSSSSSATSSSSSVSSSSSSTSTETKNEQENQQIKTFSDANITAMEQLYRRLAKSFYYKAVCQNQMMTIRVPFNTGIHAGSSIKVSAVNRITSSSKYNDTNSKEKQLEYVGTVVEVSYNVSVESQQATTTYKLIGVRSTELNAQDAFSTDRHPYWECAVDDKQTMFVGMPLFTDEFPCDTYTPDPKNIKFEKNRWDVLTQKPDYYKYINSTDSTKPDEGEKETDNNEPASE